MFKTLIKTWEKINNSIAIKATLLVGSIECFYLFLIWSLIPLVDKDAEQFVFYVSGGILQLALLPLIMVGQRLMNETNEQQAAQDHATIMAEFEEIKAMHEDLKKILQKLELD